MGPGRVRNAPRDGWCGTQPRQGLGFGGGRLRCSSPSCPLRARGARSSRFL